VSDDTSGEDPPIYDDAKPYIGARGPRKTKPKRVPPIDAKVLHLFGEEEAHAAIERQGGKRPLETRDDPLADAPRVQKRRKKTRMGEKWTRVLDELDASGSSMEDFVKTLTPEELARGQLKAKNGHFVGAPPKWVPSEFHKACIRELINRGKRLYQENYIEAIQAMTTLATDPRVEPRDRMRAAQFVIERIEGKVPDRLEVGVSEPWQELLTGIVADVPAGADIRPFHQAE
jgi:hypothetical protein